MSYQEFSDCWRLNDRLSLSRVRRNVGEPIRASTGKTEDDKGCLDSSNCKLSHFEGKYSRN